VLKGADELWVAKGRKTVRVDLKRDRPDDDELLSLLLGRSGKLRAPTMKTGKRVIVGFNAELLDEALG
jgi:arsenate reductase-like glutaredoxin family protein